VVRQHLARLPKGRTGKVLNKKDSEGYTAVHYAAKFNRFKILQLLVTSGAGERGREGDWRNRRRRKTPLSIVDGTYLLYSSFPPSLILLSPSVKTLK